LKTIFYSVEDRIKFSFCFFCDYNFALHRLVRGLPTHLHYLKDPNLTCVRRSGKWWHSIDNVSIFSENKNRFFQAGLGVNSKLELLPPLGFGCFFTIHTDKY